ncbi:MAG: 4Fe-4S dicluster domain-containing protein, partial [Acidobacteriales bacterium]|nr:4Fe-4S dicluster domain-containing protein [Terriglobales bacterium]
RKLIDGHQLSSVFYGHFGHGCVHTRISFDLQTRHGIEHYRKFVEEAAELVVSYGGSLSGEHGDGQSRAELLPKMFGEELVQAFREFKALWDPEWKMNPGKVVEPYRLDENLRLGAQYQPWEPSTHFAFHQDRGSLAQATLRCVGVGKCREYEGGAMCPSFRATREEEHSTRGRAHLLWEMTKGDVIRDGWQDENVKKSLDLCLSCKACKSDCPVGVDVATYKAEFLSHYYERRHRSRSAYAFAHIDALARLVSFAPGFANLATQLPGLRTAAKWAAGIAVERRIPAFSPQTFRQWFGGRRIRNRTGRPVILWPDTFNNYFLPETAQAAVEVLEAAGFRVFLPEAILCCGRPLYDFGFLDRARRLLRNTLNHLRTAIDEGIPVVVLEPSCAAVFRDELLDLFPGDDRAQKLSRQTFVLSEFLEKEARHFVLPKLGLKAIVHGHCHHKAIMRMNDQEAILKRMELAYEMPATSCCGMAGSFGFERDKYEVSAAIGELELLPAVRRAPAESLIIADGFSCREQIAQGTARSTLHLAEVIQMGLAGELTGIAHPERRRVQERVSKIRRSMAYAGSTLAAAGALVWLCGHER